MKIMMNGQWLMVNWRKSSGFCLLSFAFCLASCGSVPNLEEPQCTDSRLVVKEFYSYHFGNDMKFSPENLKPLEKFITPEYFRSLQSLQTENDIFTTNNMDFPKTFRVGKCEIVEPAKTNMQVLLLWKDDTRTEQKSINVEVIKQNDKWLINKILN